jgi:hypothetical protein
MTSSTSTHRRIRLQALAAHPQTAVPTRSRIERALRRSGTARNAA